MFAKTVLDNGIRVVSHEMQDHRSVSLGIWVENGSRHESDAENGISHFIEHLLFKGTERRTAAQIAEEMDAVGGVINAFTSKEHTCYYAKVLDENLPLAIDLLTDIFLHSSFDAEEIERERSVILQEISQAEDTPDDYVHDLFSIDFFKDHPIARPICGREATVNSFQREDFREFFQSALPAAPGDGGGGGQDLRHAELVTEMAARLGQVCDRGTAQVGMLEGERKPEMGSGVYPHSKELEQVHLCLGMAGIAAGRSAALSSLRAQHAARRRHEFALVPGDSREARQSLFGLFVFLVLQRCRLFRRLRRHQHRCRRKRWSSSSSPSSTSWPRASITDDELRRTQGQLVGSMMLGLESTDSWMSHVARNEIYFGKIVTTDEICRSIRAVTRDDVVALANRLFRPEAMTLTAVRRFQRRVQNQKPHGEPLALDGFLNNKSVGSWNRFAFKSSGCGRVIALRSCPAT